MMTRFHFVCYYIVLFKSNGQISSFLIVCLHLVTLEAKQRQPTTIQFRCNRLFFYFHMHGMGMVRGSRSSDLTTPHHQCSEWFWFSSVWFGFVFYLHWASSFMGNWRSGKKCFPPFFSISNQIEGNSCGFDISFI